MATLADASLSQLERETLDRASAWRRLVSVWLYGSRARGEPTGPESDVDLTVLTRGATGRGYDRARRAMDAAAKAPEPLRAGAQAPREDADYRAKRFSEEQARATLELAERFVAAVKETIEA